MVSHFSHESGLVFVHAQQLQVNEISAAMWGFDPDAVISSSKFLKVKPFGFSSFAYNQEEFTFFPGVLLPFL